jgi:hypothetical protein
MELTREEIEIFAKCGDKGNCEKCSHYDVCKVQYADAVVIRTLAKQLIAEMDKPKDDVWTNAPTDARECHATYFRGVGERTGAVKVFSRTLPKSRIDEIAEEAADNQIEYCGVVGGSWDRTALVLSYKSAILKDREERGSK